MAENTPICDFGWQAPSFELPDALGQLHRLDDYRGRAGTLIIFMCNHCPYVRGIIDRLAETAYLLEEAGIATVAINANDWTRYPEDAPEKMIEFVKAHKIHFPYLVDESQAVARAYGAVCTPDFFGFNQALELQYRGRLDESRTQAMDGVRPELLEAMRQIAMTGQGPKQQVASMGCSIKWRENT
ncbi:thioredoxin family protein [Aestuariispira insulae]|uniref:AhpC/TSA family protein n=1 Tax=Aestuariispira insulae TaxID=1461337 RepID=A0A3D9HXF0_9PROT|nr:thioredoxin family protein [Aestuariispira insulae]RED53576.1 AhpC/TSA family protein [Aestuariispira insulae]